MRIAVVTPTYRTPADWLRRCHESVAAQTVRCTHYVVNDGGDKIPLAALAGARLLDLPGPHGDAGNAARAAGTVCAVAAGFEAVAYLDADNWYEPDHLESLVDLHRRTGAAVVTSTRTLRRLDGSLLGPCPEVDGEQFVDTSCLLLTVAAFPVSAHWYLMPRRLTFVGDRYVWWRILKAGLSRAHTGRATVAYRTSFRAHYDHFGESPPPEAKDLLVTRSPDGIVARLVRG